MQEHIWHTEVISVDAQNIMRELGRQDYMKPFYLAGGTGLALQLGHRRSVDLDFFSKEPVNENALLGKLQLLPDFSLVAEKIPCRTCLRHCHGMRSRDSSRPKFQKPGFSGDSTRSRRNAGGSCAEDDESNDNRL